MMTATTRCARCALRWAASRREVPPVLPVSGRRVQPPQAGVLLGVRHGRGQGLQLEPLFRKGVEEGALKEDDLVYYQCFSLPGEPGCMAFNCPHLPALRSNTSAFARSEALSDGRRRVRRLVTFLTRHMPGFEARS